MFQGIKNLLPQSIQRAGITRQIGANLILHKYEQAAREILGKEISRQTKAMYLKNNILSVACLSSLIMQELQYREKEIIEQINKNMGANIVKKLNYLN
ncbi:MAG: DUF721 domain-containing protein [Patescibacteria group bacterium]|jgi:predicted nucleic acid-binding Zn ribbon protein